MIKKLYHGSANIDVYKRQERKDPLQSVQRKPGSGFVSAKDQNVFSIQSQVAVLAEDKQGIE